MTSDFTWRDDNTDMPRGLLVVQKGKLQILPEDDYYNGMLTRSDSVSLASQILAYESKNPFQTLIAEWIVALFSKEALENTQERCMRFLEEALELVQSTGKLDRGAAHKLVDYVYDREAGEPSQELGGTLLTLLGLAENLQLDTDSELIREFQRVSDPAFRAKILAHQQEKAAKGVGLSTPQDVECSPNET